MLNVKPGDHVVESGTGSGCMTLSLIRAISHPNKSLAGHVNTYEYNQYRSELCLWDYADTRTHRPYYHITDQNIHNNLAKYYQKAIDNS